MAHYRATTGDGEQVSAETMRQLRAAVRVLIGKRGSVRRAATRAECSAATLYRILDGKSVSLETAARVINGLGGQIEIRVTKINSHN